MRECGENGGSMTECRCMLGIAQTAWDTLIEDSEEFRIAEKIRNDLCTVWWERQGRKMSSGDSMGNSATWIFNMKNRFGWRDSHAVDHSSSDGTMTPPKPESISPTLVNALVKKLTE